MSEQVPPGAGPGELGEFDPARGGTTSGGPVLRPGTPVRHVGPPPGAEPPGGPVGAAGPVATRSEYETEPSEHDPREERRAERRVALLFVISALATFGFCVAYVFMKIHTADYGAAQNYVLGATLALALFTLGAGQVLWAKALTPKEHAVQDRHDGGSSAAEREELDQVFFRGADQLGIARFPLARRSLLFAAGVFPLAAVVLLRDLGPAPEKQLRHTAWQPGKRLVDVETKEPIQVGDMRVGSILTVMPEGYQDLPEEDWALAPTILIRTRPTELRAPTNMNWTVDGYVAYSKVCTHAGCPTSLYEQQTQNLLCPCHQSTFKVTEGCRVIFGPAARALPQLPIAVDNQGYFVAQSDYREPVGPSFWERG